MNPIIMRELVRQLRLPRTFLQLFFLLLLFGVIFCFSYFVSSQTWTLEQRDGRVIFFPLVYFACFLVVPVATMAATCIVREREAETFDLLLTTPLNYSSILLGKLIACLLYVFLIITSLLPFLSICFVIGGLAPDEVIQCVFVIGGFYCITAMLGITISLFSASSHAAGRYIILALMIFLLGPYTLILLYYLISNHEPGQFMAAIVFFYNPVVMLFFIHNPASQSQLSTNSMQFTGVLNGIFSIFLTGILFLLTAFLFRRFSAQLSNHLAWKQFIPKRKSKKSQSSKQSEIFPYFMERARAVFQKEIIPFKRKILSRDSTIITGCSLSAAFIGWLFLSLASNSGAGASADLDILFTYTTICIFCLIIAWFFAPLAPSYSIQTEYNRATWPLLRTSNLRSLDIVRGKVFSTFRQSMVPLLSLVIPFYLSNLVFFYWYNRPPRSFFFLEITFVILFFLCCIFFYSTVGVLYSSKSRNQKSSPHRNTYMVVMLHLFLPLIIIGIIQMGMMIVIGPFSNYSGPQRSYKEMQKTIETIVEVILPFSPFWVFFQREWSFLTYLILTLHSTVVTVIGFFLMFATGVELKKRE